MRGMAAAANPLYGSGTHRTNQCKETMKTPGPGTYRQLSSFPAKDEMDSNAQVFPRAPRALLNGRGADRGGMFVQHAVIPPSNANIISKS
mmetsp:Transcript_61685/g.75634  ORF Transcript_61685/g.75634 Transcript_61685/m.75634 type:complete len:90 (-) Transcript_61685:90-359(-)